MFASVQDHLACLGSGTYVSWWLWCTWVGFRLRQHAFLFTCVAIYIFNCTAVAPMLACASLCVFVSSCLCVYACLNEWVSLCVCVCVLCMYMHRIMYIHVCVAVYICTALAPVLACLSQIKQLPVGLGGRRTCHRAFFQNKNWKSDFKSTWDQWGLPWHCGDNVGRVVLVMVWSLWSDLWGGDRDDLLKILAWSSDLWSWSDHCHGTWRAPRRLRTTRWGSRRWHDHHFDCKYSFLLTNYILHCLQLHCICFDLSL